MLVCEDMLTPAWAFYGSVAELGRARAWHPIFAWRDEESGSSPGAPSPACFVLRGFFGLWTLRIIFHGDEDSFAAAFAC